MKPIWIELIDTHGKKVIVNACLIEYFRTSSRDKDITYVSFGNEHLIGVKHTVEELRSIIDKATD